MRVRVFVCVYGVLQCTSLDWWSTAPRTSRVLRRSGNRTRFLLLFLLLLGLRFWALKWCVEGGSVSYPMMEDCFSPCPAKSLARIGQRGCGRPGKGRAHTRTHPNLQLGLTKPG